MTEPPNVKSWSILAAILGLVFGAILLIHSCAPAHAHDHDHPELDGWYPTLKSETGGFCCDGPGTDAVHLADVDWESKDGHYRVRIEGQWIDVPDDRVVKGPNRDGRTLVWPVYYRGAYGEILRINIRCFLPGAGT